MILDALQAAGGLGLFLLGMVTLRDGLKALAGAAVESALRRFTRSPLSGALTGATTTALVQSSSVTTVSAVGFASAGLLSFPAALGIVFGANVGTTVTGWLVALLGFKLQLAVVMPLAVLVGIVTNLVGRYRVAAFGLALAGFGLAFVGIEILRASTFALQGVLTPESFPGDTFLGRLELVGLGIVLTLVTQSSSAGVATALAAVAAGAMHFEQAAALVIGMDVGTTFTAGLATVGASLAGRRTGWAHVIYNGMTAIGALLVLPLFVLFLEWMSPGLLSREPEFALVGFHTFFNTAGLICVLPFTKNFARLVERLVPERPSPFTQRLDPRWLPQPEVALRAIGPTLTELAEQAFSILRYRLAPTRATSPPSDLRALLVIALDEVSDYLAQVPPAEASRARLAASLHVIDQLGRLLDREAQLERAETASRHPELTDPVASLIDRLPVRLSGLDPSGLGEIEAGLAQLCARLESERQRQRETAATRTAADILEPEEALAIMDAYRWIERSAHHAWRVTHHLAQLSRESPTSLVVEPPEPD